MKNLKFQVLLDGDTKISVVASGEDTGFSEAGDIFPRLRPNLSPDQLEELRLGAPAPDVVDEVAEALSNWLLSNDLRYALDAELDTGGEQGVRLVFAVDERLPPLAEMPLELLRLDDDSYLLLDPRVSAIVHLLPKVGSKKTPPESAAGRLKILIVRSQT